MLIISNPHGRYACRKGEIGYSHFMYLISRKTIKSIFVWLMRGEACLHNRLAEGFALQLLLLFLHHRADV